MDLTRWKDTTVAPGKVLGLLSRGWRRGQPQDGGGIWYFSKPLGDGRVIELELSPGFGVGMLADAEEQTLGRLLLGTPAEWGQMNGEDQRPWSELDAVLASELVRDMQSLSE